MADRTRMFLYALGVWVVFVLLAIANGGFREAVVVPRVGEDAGHVVGTLLLCALILVVAYGYFRITPIAHSRRELWLVGLFWMVLTNAFEFAFFSGVVGLPVDEILANYNVLEGRLWMLVVLTTLLAPRVVDAAIRR